MCVLAQQALLSSDGSIAVMLIKGTSPDVAGCGVMVAYTVLWLCHQVLRRHHVYISSPFP